MLLKKILNSSEAQIVTLLLLITGLAPAISVLYTGRESFDDAVLVMYEIAEESPSFTFISRVLNFCIGLLLLMIIKKIITKRIYLTKRIKNLFLSFIVFLIFNYGISSIFGTYPGPPTIYFILCNVVLILLTLISGPTPEILIHQFKIISFIMLFGTLIWAIFLPDTAYFTFMEESVIEEKRLIGFFNHPRQLGVVALFLLAMELRIIIRGWLHIFIVLVAAVTLIMSISKTAIILGSIYIYWHVQNRNKFHFIILLGLTFIAYLLLTTLYPDLLSSSNDVDLTSMTGRDVIWKTVIDSWSSNPLFGNGPTYFMDRIHISFINAHNIFLQCLSDGGLLGLLALFIYLFALIDLAIQNRSASNNVSISLVLLLFLFSLTEMIMRLDNFVTGNFYINAFLITYLCALDRARCQHAYQITKE